MGLIRSSVLAVGLALLLVSAATAMPANPVAVEKAGGVYALSKEVLAAPPDYVDQPLDVPAWVGPPAVTMG